MSFSKKWGSTVKGQFTSSFFMSAVVLYVDCRSIIRGFHKRTKLTLLPNLCVIYFSLVYFISNGTVRMDVQQFTNLFSHKNAIYCIKQCSDQAKANIFFDVCRLFFDLFHLFFDLFRFRVRSVWTGPYSYVNVITPLIFELLFSWKMLFFFHFSSSKWLDDFLRQDNYQRRKREDG